MYYKWNKYYHNDEELERLFQQAAQHYHPDYQEEDWNALEDLLEQKQKKKSIGFISMQVRGLILLGALTLIINIGVWMNLNTQPKVSLEKISQTDNTNQGIDKQIKQPSDSTANH